MRKQSIVSKILRSFCFYIVFILARITNEYTLSYYLFIDTCCALFSKYLVECNMDIFYFFFLFPSSF